MWLGSSNHELTCAKGWKSHRRADIDQVNLNIDPNWLSLRQP